MKNNIFLIEDEQGFGLGFNNPNPTKDKYFACSSREEAARIRDIIELYAMEFLKERVGYLRQWLNEDRITDHKKMVSNEDILTWFNANNKLNEK